MDDTDANPSLTHLEAVRIDTGGSPPSATAETVPVMVEGRLTIEVEQVDSYTLLYTPGDELALAAGFALTAGSWPAGSIIFRK